MKKYYHLIFLFLLSASSYAIAEPLYYVGADAGIFRADFNNDYIDQLDVIPLNIAQPVMQYAYTVGGKFGFRMPYTGQIFWGGELAGHYENHHASFQSGASSTSFSDQTKVEGNLDLSFVPGLMLTNSLASYLKLGISVAYVQDNLTSPAGTLAIMENYNSNKVVPGFTAGLGLTQYLTQCMSIYAEANYYDYGVVNFPGFQNFSTFYTHSSHVYTYNVLVGAAYNFNL